MLTEGMYVADRYEIISKIGTGGMADVYKAMDLTLGRNVAIKVLKPEFSEDLNFVTKFRTEAQSAAGLEHPNIVNIYDVGSENGMHYIVMECVEGITLKTYIEKKGQLSFKETVSIAIQVGRGIEAAHNKGIIHRDIKPQNIIISTEGKVKVTDFGIARVANANTISSDVMGSVHYSSPEQARNGFVDGKSDIYSLGIVMYEMVTGRVPFDGDTTVAVAIQHLQEEMVSPSAYAPNLPVSMEKIILKCTQKNPDRRYESMTALLADLRKALVSPDEDFVVMVPLTNQDKTRVIAGEELKQIKDEAGSIYLKADEAVRAQKEETEYDTDELEDEDEDGELNPKMEKAITIMGIAAAVIIVIIIVAIVVNLFGGFGSKKKNNTETETQTTQTEAETETDTTTAETLALPSLLGMTFDEAEEKLAEMGLKLENKGEVSSDDYEEDLIANQDPVAGTVVKAGDTVSVVISNGKGNIDVPSVVGKSESEAVSMLNEEEFKPDKTYSYSDSVAAGDVISQNPVSGSKAKKGDTVTLVISQGKEAVTVPDVYTTYKSEEQAKQELAAFNVSVKTSYSDTYPEGIVMAQSIEPGKQVEKGTAITITISQGPEPSKEVTAATYKCNVTLKLPAGTEGVSGASAILYDASGNVLAQWSNQAITTVNDAGEQGVKLAKGGLMVSSGKLVVTWLDANGDKINDQTVDSLEFTKES